MVLYHANGSVRGSCGHKHKSVATALKCANNDGKSIAHAFPGNFPTRAYSDRTVERLDGEPLSENEELELERLICWKW